VDYLPDNTADELLAWIRRIQHALGELSRRLPRTDVRVSSAGGEVVVSVDSNGGLAALWLAPGVTARFTCKALERLINDTVRTAVDTATTKRSPAMSA
jgi:hypothetical protein